MFESHERPSPELAADEVLIAVEATVLGSPELGSSDLGDRIPGGAAVGTVVAGGENATGAIGNRAVVGPEQACGECDICRRGGTAVCPNGYILGRTADGTLATHVVARARWLCTLDGDLAVPGPSACLIGREAARAYAMFARAGVAPGEPVVIVGADVVARFLAEIAIARGTQPVVVIAPESVEFAAWLRSRGALAARLDTRSDPRDAAPDAGDSSWRAMVAAAAQQRGFERRPWNVFETSGTAQHRARACSLLGPAGTLVLLASPATPEPERYSPDVNRSPSATARPSPIDVEAIARADGRCIGVAGAHPDLLPEVAALAVRGDLDLAGAADVSPIAAIGQIAIGDDVDPPRAHVITITSS